MSEIAEKGTMDATEQNNIIQFTLFYIMLQFDW